MYPVSVDVARYRGPHTSFKMRCGRLCIQMPDMCHGAGFMNFFPFLNGPLACNSAQVIMSVHVAVSIGRSGVDAEVLISISIHTH